MPTLTRWPDRLDADRSGAVRWRAVAVRCYGAGRAGAGRPERGGPDGASRAPCSLAWAGLVGFPLIFLALLALVYPTTSVDLYDYMFRGRMLAHYQANTFIQVPIEFNADPLFWYVAWRKAVTAYGPLWEGMSWLTARLAGETTGRLLYGQAAQCQGCCA